MNQVEKTQYIPGVCNINMVEVAYRRKWRNIGLISALVLLAILLVMGANRFARLGVFLPLFIGMVGYYQTKHRFCVSYGASGLQNAKAGSTTASKVTPEQAALDKSFARKINTKAALISVGLTLITLLIPIF